MWTIVACGLIMGQLLWQTNGNFTDVSHPQPSWEGLCLSFGTIFFSYGGAAAFPTIQHDMKNKAQFSSAVTISFISMFYIKYEE